MGEDADSKDDSGAKVRERKRLIERFREAIRARHYSRRTEEAYWYWVRFFIFFSGKRHPAELGAAEVNAFLSWLASASCEYIAPSCKRGSIYRGVPESYFRGARRRMRPLRWSVAA